MAGAPPAAAITLVSVTASDAGGISCLTLFNGRGARLTNSSAAGVTVDVLIGLSGDKTRCAVAPTLEDWAPSCTGGLAGPNGTWPTRREVNFFRFACLTGASASEVEDIDPADGDEREEPVRRDPA